MKEMRPSELLAYLGSLVGIITVAQGFLRTLFPPPLRHLLQLIFDMLHERLTRYHYVDIPEHDEFSLTNELYGAIKLHLITNAMTFAPKATRVKLCRTSGSADLVWSPAHRQSIPMCFQGATMWWEHHVTRVQSSKMPSRSHLMDDREDRRKYTLTVHKRDKEHVVAPYMKHILKQAQDIKHKNRQRFLYTNGKGGGYFGSAWDSVPFKHPSTFGTLAMDPVHKARVQDDLLAFVQGQGFYQKTGRAWKRGYLLHGPPGTGKSSLIAAMANFLRYDVYDLELTHVRSNGDLRKMLLKTTCQSIIVIEDIDCSLDLVSNRAKKPSSSSSSRRKESRYDDGDDPMPSITLSGLLNFTDGLWSCCGEERIFVFTTNHVENLDPALLRPGRMDMHIFMSFCTYPACKILVSNYLDLDEHPLLEKVDEIIADAHVTPAWISEVLMRKRDQPNKAMEELVAELEVAKAKPWPPPMPAKKGGGEEAKEEDVIEEVKKVVEVEEERSSYAERQRCPHCPCGRKVQKNRKHKGKGYGKEDEAAWMCKENGDKDDMNKPEKVD